MSLPVFQSIEALFNNVLLHFWSQLIGIHWGTILFVPSYFTCVFHLLFLLLFYLPLFLYEHGQQWYLLSQFFLLSTQNNLCDCCGLWDMCLLLFWHQVKWKSEKLLLHKSEKKQFHFHLNFPEPFWEGFTIFFISLQTFGHLSWFHFSLPACVRGAGVVNLTVGVQ